MVDKIYHWSSMRLSDSKSKSDPKEVREVHPAVVIQEPWV